MTTQDHADIGYGTGQWNISSSRYTAVAIILHWTTAAIMLVTIPLGVYSADSEGPLSDAITNVHKCLTAHMAHETLGWLTMALIVLHIIAAFKHHFIERDNVMRRMLGTKERWRT